MPIEGFVAWVIFLAFIIACFMIGKKLARWMAKQNVKREIKAGMYRQQFEDEVIDEMRRKGEI